VENGERAICCASCKKNDMKNIKDKKCECGKSQPVFGYPGERAICCASCKKENMVDVKNKKCKCGKSQPVFGYPGERAICCASCKEENMEDLKTKKCPNCSLWTDPHKANKKYKGYCARCFQRLFPTDPLASTIRCKTKELMVRDYLNNNFKDFIHDTYLTTPHCDCLRRIDHRTLIEGTLLCVETDENQHKYYDKNDEEKRYNDVHISWGVGKVVWIRFNPDPFVINGKKCNPHMSTRLWRLGKEINRHIDRIQRGKNERIIEMHFLYYDME
jgi:hypothetical protein